ncbi:DEAD/DEAH box helicase, partial [Pseudomonas syringae pv. tagetis]
RRASAVRPLQVLWVTPLRALASDTARALQSVVDGLGLGWRVGLRSGDASNRERRQAREGRVDVLVTTPESLALLLSY